MELDNYVPRQGLNHLVFSNPSITQFTFIYSLFQALGSWGERKKRERNRLIDISRQFHFYLISEWFLA